MISILGSIPRGSFFIPLLVLFFGLGLFYWLAPRRSTRFSEDWVAALCATALLLAAEKLFVIYLKHFATLSAVYGAFGGIMALLLGFTFPEAFSYSAPACAPRTPKRVQRQQTLFRRALQKELNHEEKHAFSGTAPQEGIGL